MQELESIRWWLESSGRVPDEARDLLDAVKENLADDLGQVAAISSVLKDIPTDDDFEFGCALVHLGAALRGLISTVQDLEEVGAAICDAEIPEGVLVEGPTPLVVSLRQRS